MSVFVANLIQIFLASHKNLVCLSWLISSLTYFLQTTSTCTVVHFYNSEIPFSKSAGHKAFFFLSLFCCMPNFLPKRSWVWVSSSPRFLYTLPAEFCTTGTIFSALVWPNQAEATLNSAIIRRTFSNLPKFLFYIFPSPSHRPAQSYFCLPLPQLPHIFVLAQVENFYFLEPRAFLDMFSHIRNIVA